MLIAIMTAITPWALTRSPTHPSRSSLGKAVKSPEAQTAILFSFYQLGGPVPSYHTQTHDFFRSTYKATCFLIHSDSLLSSHSPSAQVPQIELSFRPQLPSQKQHLYWTSYFLYRETRIKKQNTIEIGMGYPERYKSDVCIFCKLVTDLLRDLFLTFALCSFRDPCFSGINIWLSKAPQFADRNVDQSCWTSASPSHSSCPLKPRSFGRSRLTFSSFNDPDIT